MTVGLTQAEAARRLAERGPVEPPASSRSTASIVRANVLTIFNAILLVLGAATLAFGDWRDALFLGIIVTNSGIGIAQELRAKRALDRLAALVAPHATVVRDGAERVVAVEQVAPGDVVRVQPGDQVVADGPLVEADGLALDESILTGESQPVVKGVGDAVRSGSFVLEGAGAYAVVAVGQESYAERIAGEAREFRHPRSPLERAINRLLLLLVAVMVPLGALLVGALWERDVGVREAVTTAVAGIVTLVPEGLILLASLTFAAAAIQLARRGVLAQQLNAIESLASVDTLCLDKTGTLTQARLRVVDVSPGIEEPLARFAASSPAKNATLVAIAEALPGEAEDPRRYEPFSSARRYSSVELRDGKWVLGAPELFGLEAAEDGRRVLAFGRDGFDPLGTVTLAEDLRPDARETVAYLLAEGVELKVISGDAPETVAAIARDVGIPVEHVHSGDDAPLEATVVGRISPEGKRDLVQRLRDAGRYVAFIGDGVNDVPALKAARLGIAQGTGAQMAKSVADIVLVSGDFAAVPRMVAEGRKILRNVQRVAKLFVTKSVFAVFLILSIGVTPQAYPLLPRHLTLAAALAIGIPGFFLALAPSTGGWRTTRFLREVARFAVPAGVAAGLGVLAAYLTALNVFDLGLVTARTVATTTLIAIGLYLIVALEATGGRRSMAVGALVGVLGVLYVVVLALPGMRAFFELAVPGVGAVVIAALGFALAVGFLWLTDDRFVPGRGG